MAVSEKRSTVEILRAARERIGDPEQWTRGEYARDAKGHTVRPQYPTACSWCAVGSICAELGLDPIIGDNPGIPEVKALGLNVRLVNDYQGHAATLALFDRAIELAEAGA
jgi:hypothetical protein